MAILHTSTHNGNTYEIRAAGATLRLYTNQVLHTQYNPLRGLTGSIWDLFFLPSYWLCEDKQLKVLVLGVGGGACVRQYSQYKNAAVIGVEYDEHIVNLSRKFFLSDAKNLHLICQDAFEWVKRQTPKHQGDFDIIIEDLFKAHKGEPVKQSSKLAPTAWLQTLTSMIKKDGLLIINFPGAADATSFLDVNSLPISKYYPSVFRFCAPACGNTVVVLSKKNRTSAELRKSIQKDHRLPKNLVRYAVRQAKG